MTFEKKRKDKNYELEKEKKTVVKKEVTQLCVWVDSEKYKKLKVRAAMDGMTIKDVICKNINIYLHKIGDI